MKTQKLKQINRSIDETDQAIISPDQTKLSIKKDKKRKKMRSDKRRRDLREGRALGPYAAIVADDGGGGEMLAVDLTHEVVIYVRLPRHFFTLFFFGQRNGLRYSIIEEG